jgi:hypothetical protein
VRDKCLTDKPAECAQQAWIESATANGITSGTLESDLCLHGNYPHTNLLEGNVGYIAVFDYVHYANGPNHLLYRNSLRGQPKPYGYWQEGDSAWVDGPSDHETFIGNHLLNDSVIQLLMSDGPRLPLETFVGANVVHGAVEAGDLAQAVSLPPSLYLDAKPDFWPAGMAWPPFGPDVSASATNKIPAQVRYESGQYFPK